MPGPSDTGALVGVGVACGGASGGLRRGGLGRVADDDRDLSRGGRGRRLRHDRHGRDRRRLCRGNGRRRDGWSRRLLLTRILGRERAGGCRVHSRSGRHRRRADGARRGRGRRSRLRSPEVGTAPMPGVGAGADNPYPSATVASTRLTTPRASTRRRRCVPLTWILGSPKATGGRRPAASSRRMVAPVRRRPATRAIQPSIATSIGS